MEWKEFETTFPVQLNSQQKEAVQSTEGPVLLLAVPGSGKTTVLVTRLGYMIYCKNIRPESVLTLTYSIAATRDMSARFTERFGEEMAGKTEFRTINGICAKILQYYGRKGGGWPVKLIENEKVRSDILNEICQAQGMGYQSESDRENIKTLITYIKNMMLCEEDIQKLDEKSEVRIAGIYQEYRKRMRENKWMDYDDQMVYAYNILCKDSEVLTHFQNLYPYICVDEAQDTSKIQHAIIALLAAGTGNLFMVGDEDQSIYGYRAAYPKALLSFEKDHPGAKVLLMEENFRSNAKIVEAADKFIQKNTLRHEKHMKAAREAGSDIKEISLKSRKEQYVYLMKAAQNCTAHMDGQENLQGSGTAVLYRNNECVIPLIDLLERGNIPYQMRKSELSFFTHNTVLDVENIIRFALNPKDTDIFGKIYYKFKLFIRKEDALRYINISKEKDMEVLDAALRYGNLERDQEEKIRALKRQMERLLKMRGDEAVNWILTHMGYQDYLKRAGKNANKLDTVRLIGSRTESPEKLLERLEELKTIIQEKQPDRNCPFILSTIHASKGLEYDTVYLLDVVDGILPEKVPANPRTAAKEEIETYEEERRLFYVAVTRAKNQLNVFTTNKPSKFCSELLGKRNWKEDRQRENAGTYGENVSGMYHGYGRGHESQNIKYGRNHSVDFYMKDSASSRQEHPGKTYQELADALGEGMIVKHKKYGEGVIVDMEGSNIRIQFGERVRNMDLKMLAKLGMLEI